MNKKIFFQTSPPVTKTQGYLFTCTKSKKNKKNRDNKNDICFCFKYYENYFCLGFSNTEIYPATNNQPEHDKDNKTKNHQITLYFFFFLVKKKNLKA